jgi:SulP family sulfate permease
VVVLVSVLLFASLLAHVPMASLAGLLLVVAWNMSEVRHFRTILRIAPKSDVLVLLTCFVLTILFDMVVAVSFGVVLASLLFMRRTAELTQARLFEPESGIEADVVLPPHVALYEVAGPLFFGAAQHAMGALQSIGSQSHVVVLALGRVPSIDATGLVALESALEQLRKAKKKVVLAGPLPEPRVIFERAGLEQHHPHIAFAATREAAIELAGQLAEAAAGSLAPPTQS